jgi:hypothetical protein
MSGYLPDLLEKFGLCPWCLSIKDSRFGVAAVGNGFTEFLPNDVYVTDPPGLVRWVDQMIAKHGYPPDVRFRINDTYDRFVPVAVIGGTPVCAVDLWRLTSSADRR